MTTSSIEQIKGAKADRHGHYQRQYLALVNLLADGGKPDPNEAVDLMESAGKSDEDLERDVEAEKRRRECRKRDQAADEAGRQRWAVEQEILRTNAERDRMIAEAQATHAAKVAPLKEQAKQLQQRETHERSIADWNRDRLPVVPVAPHVAAQREEVQRKEAGINAERKKALSQIEQCRLNIVEERQRADRARPADRDHYLGNAASAERRLQGYETALQRLDVELAELAHLDG